MFSVSLGWNVYKVTDLGIPPSHQIEQSHSVHQSFPGLLQCWQSLPQENLTPTITHPQGAGLGALLSTPTPWSFTLNKLLAITGDAVCTLVTSSGEGCSSQGQRMGKNKDNNNNSWHRPEMEQPAPLSWSVNHWSTDTSDDLSKLLLLFLFLTSFFPYWCCSNPNILEVALWK